MIAALSVVVLVLGIGLQSLRRSAQRETQALEAERARFATLFRLLPEAAWLKDQDGLFIDCNPLCEQMVGRRREALIGRHAAEVFGIEAATSGALSDAQAMAGDKPVRYEAWLDLSGEHRLYQFTKTRVHDAQGLVIGVLGVARDITELHEGRERFRRLFEGSSQATVLVEGRHCVDANAAALALFAAPSREALLQTLPERLWPERQADGSETAAAAALLRERIAATGWAELDWDLLRLDGSLFTARMRVTSIRFDERSLLHVVLNDVTEQKRLDRELAAYRAGLERRVADRTAELDAVARELGETNERLRAILDGAAAGIAWVRDGRFVQCNRRLAELVGQPALALLGRPVSALDAGDGGAFAADAGVAREHLLRREDGSTFWARVSTSAIDPEDAGKGLVVQVIDVSAEHAAAEDRERARRLAEDAARTKSDFLANMSHEIRTPLNAVIGMTRILSRTEMSPRQQDCVSKIQDSSHHLLAVVDDILDFSRLEAGKLRIEQVEFDLEALLQHVGAQVAERAAAKDLEFVIDVAPEVPARLVGDPLRLGQVLINYVNNAVKFTDDGEIAIEVRELARLGPRSMLELAVRDTGIGISPEQRQRLFQSFQQADSSTTRRFGGTGLGLAICRRLATLMGGDVGVDSEVDVGSTFWLRLPLPIAGETAETAAAPPPAAFAGRRLLVVDDHGQARAVTASLLRRQGFSVDSADSAAAALDLVERAFAASAPYALAVVDWKMPGTDGLELALRLRSAPPPRPQVLLMTHGDPAELARLTGADVAPEVLQKPVSASALHDALARVLGGTPRAGVHAESGAALRFDGLQALLVEDNDINREVGVELLREHGLEVDTAHDGREAVHCVRERHYDIVFMDMQMPVMDGLDATRAIRLLPGGTALPIVAMTANALPADRERCLAAGMDDHVAKPIDPAVLAARLRHWLGREAGASAGAAPEPDPAPRPDEDAAVLDPAAGLRLAGGRQALYRNLLRVFTRTQKDICARVRTAMDEDRWVEAERTAHTLKGTAAQIGASPLRDAAAHLEHAIHHRADGDRLDGPLERVQQALQAVLDAIEAGEAQAG
ncbi:response regulator [Rubrivivax gelatinosus]|uniref:response regulator n=2 Tax=Rubrivivax gelatinosus TaxID=28068 RepID=UPI0018CBCF61|nr:response regulator [Rubrivivax gelatinosus]